MNWFEIIVFCALIALANLQSAKGKDDNNRVAERGDIPEYELITDESTESNSSSELNNDDGKFDDRIDDYIKFIRLQYEQFLAQCDTKLLMLRERYWASVEGVEIEQSFVIDYAVRFEEMLQPLEFLNDVGKNCIAKYRLYIPTVAHTENALKICTVTVSTEIDSLLTKVVEFKSTLETYYNIDFNKRIKSCRQTYFNDAKADSACVREVVLETNSFTIEAQKNFEYLLDAARCAVKAYTKKVIGCSVSTHYKTTYSIAEANTLIDNCRRGKDDCQPCAEHTCSSSYHLKVDYTATTIANPFHGLSKHAGCLMLNVQ